MQLISVLHTTSVYCFCHPDLGSIVDICRVLRENAVTATRRIAIITMVSTRPKIHRNVVLIRQGGCMPVSQHLFEHGDQRAKTKAFSTRWGLLACG